MPVTTISNIYLGQGLAQSRNLNTNIGTNSKSKQENYHRKFKNIAENTANSIKISAVPSTKKGKIPAKRLRGYDSYSRIRESRNPSGNCMLHTQSLYDQPKIFLIRYKSSFHRILIIESE